MSSHKSSSGGRQEPAGDGAALASSGTASLNSSGLPPAPSASRYTKRHLLGALPGTVLCGRSPGKSGPLLLGVAPGSPKTGVELADCTSCLASHRRGPLALLEDVAHELRRVPHQVGRAIIVFLGESDRALEYLLSVGGYLSDEERRVVKVIEADGQHGSVLFWARPGPQPKQAVVLPFEHEELEELRRAVAQGAHRIPAPQPVPLSMSSPLLILIIVLLWPCWAMACNLDQDCPGGSYCTGAGGHCVDPGKPGDTVKKVPEKKTGQEKCPAPPATTKTKGRRPLPRRGMHRVA